MDKNVGVSPIKSSVIDTDDREAHPKHWFVVETRMNHEKKVRDQLEKLGIECFLPIQIVVRQWTHRKKKVEQLLIPMKIFVNIRQQDKLPVLGLPSVVRLMQDRTRNGAVIIPDNQMSQFMLMLHQSEMPVHLCNLNLESGMSVRVINGPLLGLEGCLIAHDGRSKIKIEIDVLGAVYVEIPFEDVEVISKQVN